MEKVGFPEEAKKIMQQRFGRDTLIALATAEGNAPWVRTVDGYYEDGSFYVVTHAASNKVKQIQRNPQAAVSGDWFTARGTAENLGWIGRQENRAIAETLKRVFAGWLGNGHTDPAEETTCILRIRLDTGTLFSHGTRYDISFRG